MNNDEMLVLALGLFFIAMLLLIFKTSKNKAGPKTPIGKNPQEDQDRQKYNKNRQLIMAILEDGKLPDIDWERHHGPLHFKLMKSEHLIYVFSGVQYFEQRTKREMVGRSVGTSVRVAKGVSFRVGASKGTPVEKDEYVDRGVGKMAITTKHLYFNRERRSFRIPFGKMVSVESMEDAVIVTRDRASAQPEVFVMGVLLAPPCYDLLQAVPSLEMGSNPERDNGSSYLSSGGIDADYYPPEDDSGDES